MRGSDTEIAKNYLSQQELDALNKIVSAYLDIAEVRALAHEPMHHLKRTLSSYIPSEQSLPRYGIAYHAATRMVVLGSDGGFISA